MYPNRWRVRVALSAWMVSCALVCAGDIKAADEPLHQCAVQLRLNSHDAGYNGTGTGTLVKHGDGYYLVTALHNLQRAETKLAIPLEPNTFFWTDDFESHFVSILDSDLAVAKFKEEYRKRIVGKRFGELLRDRKRTKVLNPTPGQNLAAVGNPVFAYESFKGEQTNIVYHGTVAEYAKPEIVVGDAAYISARMMVLESLSVMPGFSGGPLLLIRDGEAGIGDIAGIVVGGDPRSIVSPGRFVFAVPPSDIEKAISALDTGLRNPTAPVPDGIVLAKTDLASVPKSNATGLRFGVDRVVVIDVKSFRHLEQVTDQFLAGIARYVKNADMVFYGGTFGDVNLSQLQPTRATYVGCLFTNENALSRANLMGARFVDCEVMPAGGGPARPIKVLPTLGYGITIIEGLGKRKYARKPIAPIFVEVGEQMAFASEVHRSAKVAEVKAAPTPSDDRVKLTNNQFENLLTRDLFNGK